MPSPSSPYQPYAAQHKHSTGPGDSRPSSLQIMQDCGALSELRNKIVLITGCSSGIGVETARALYEGGATLFLQARNMTKLEGVIEDIVSKAEYNKSGPKPQGIEMHLDSLVSVRKGAENFKKRSGGKLDILINNAGVMAAPYSKTQDNIETQIGVNHFAHFLLFQLLKPCLLASASSSGTTSRVINVTSAGHRFSSVIFTNKSELDAWNRGEVYEKWKAYGQSKTANIWMASSITRHYGSQNLQGLSVHPGGIMTELARHLTQEDLDSFGDWEELQKNLKSPTQGAATTIWAAVSGHFEGQNGGQYLADVGETSLADGELNRTLAQHAPWAYDQDREEELWKLSCDVVGVSGEA